MALSSPEGHANLTQRMGSTSPAADRLWHGERARASSCRFSGSVENLDISRHTDIRPLAKSLICKGKVAMAQALQP